MICLLVPAVEREIPLPPQNRTPVAMNHLFVGKQLSEKKRLEMSGQSSAAVRPRCPAVSDELTNRLDLYATPQQAPQNAYRWGIDFPDSLFHRGKIQFSSGVYPWYFLYHGRAPRDG